jgi:hypothetical protein
MKRKLWRIMRRAARLNSWMGVMWCGLAMLVTFFIVGAMVIQLCPSETMALIYVYTLCTIVGVTVLLAPMAAWRKKHLFTPTGERLPWAKGCITAEELRLAEWAATSVSNEAQAAFMQDFCDTFGPLDLGAPKEPL